MFMLPYVYYSFVEQICTFLQRDSIIVSISLCIHLDNYFQILKVVLDEHMLHTKLLNIRYTMLEIHLKACVDSLLNSLNMSLINCEWLTLTILDCIYKRTQHKKSFDTQMSTRNIEVCR